MSQRALLKQARLGITKEVAVNPETVTVPRKPTTDDGFGGQVEDPFGVPVNVTLTVCVSKERRFLNKLEPAPVGYTTAGRLYVFSDYQNEIVNGDVIDTHGKKYEIEAVYRMEKFGGVIGYESPLKDSDG